MAEKVKTNTTIRRLTEAFVRKKIKDLKNDPDRGTRYLVDLALHLSKGRFQQKFFQAAQTMLKNRQSSYYALIRDIILHVDENHLVTFGMNLGYNSLTAGARAIRETEAAQGFNIPWEISLFTSEASYDSMEASYRTLLNQGMELGVYSWIFYARSGAKKLLPLIRSYPDCAFLLILDAKEATAEFLDQAARLKNLMVSVLYNRESSHVYAHMRKRRMLYSACVPCDPVNTPKQKVQELLSEVSRLHPAFTLFAPSSSDLNDPSPLHGFIEEIRNSQTFPTIPMELREDARAVDGIISTDACTLTFDENGRICKEYSTSSMEDLSFLSMPLTAVLKKGYAKNHAFS